MYDFDEILLSINLLMLSKIEKKTLTVSYLCNKHKIASIVIVH